ncbi:MAG: DUF488 domain-containing protein [Chloroflexi bacterium]|nr:DUF488 domain-containing protein [Chloroflexota bacterium]
MAGGPPRFGRGHRPACHLSCCQLSRRPGSSTLGDLTPRLHTGEAHVSIRIKRAYDPSEPDDGARFLIDRLWPRGVRKEALRVDGWLRDVAPSAELRRWFGHDAARWPEFRSRYFAELDGRSETWQPLLDAARRGTVTLVYGARDREHNDAVALREYLEDRSGEPGHRQRE